MTDFLDVASGAHGTVSQNTNRYIIGPTIELHLPFGFGVEFDVLYRHFSYNSTANLVDVFSTSRTTAGNWEFPLLVKKNLGKSPLRPFVDAGVNFSKLSGLSQSVESVLSPNRITSSSTGSPAELQDDFSKGFVMGAGVDFHLLMIHVTPELRYTRWGSQMFNSSVISGAVSTLGGSVTSNQNQAEFLVGFTF